MSRVDRRPFESGQRPLVAALTMMVALLGCDTMQDGSSKSGSEASTSSETQASTSGLAPVAEPRLRRDIPVPASIAGSEPDEESAGFPIEDDHEADLESLATLLLDLRVASTTAAPLIEHPGGGTPRGLVRAYVRGRTAMVVGDASTAIEALETAVRDGGGPKVLSTLAEALELAGRSSDALAIRRELARRGWLDARDARRVVDSLRRRGLARDAVAIAASRVLTETDPIERLHIAVELTMALEASGRRITANLMRDAILSESPKQLEAFCISDPVFASILWRAAGDDAARRGDAAAADDRWRTAQDLSPELTGWTERLAWSAASLGHDPIVRALILEATSRPGEIPVDQIRLFRECGVDLREVSNALAERLQADPDRSETARLLAVCDPQLAARTFAAIAKDGQGAAIAGPLVAASVSGGVNATWAVARSFGRDPELLDVVVDQLLGGPWKAEDLLGTILAEVEPSTTDEIDASTAVVAAEVFRRHARPDLASRMLDAAVESTPATRVVRIRLAADLLDPIRVAEVGAIPFDARVETERVMGLLTAGEPELALQRVDEALLEASDEASLVAARGRVLGTLRGQAASGLAELRRAWSMGDRRPETLIEIIMLLSRLPADVRQDQEGLDRLRRSVLEDSSFRRLLEADQALATGDPIEAEKIVMPLLENPEWRSVAIPRLLAAWRASGRLADGQARLAGQVAAHPSDPVLADALFAMDRAIRGPRAMAADFRGELDTALSGLPARSLELILTEISEAREERLELAARRIDRAGSGVVNSLDRVEWTLLVSDSGDPQVFSLLSAIDPEDLTPRLRRRFVSLAAAAAVVTEAEVSPGRDAVMRVAEWHRAGGIPVDVDTALAIVHGLGSAAGAEALRGLPAAPPITIQDPAWRDRLLAEQVISSVRLGSITAALFFAVDTLDPGQVPSTIVRSAVVLGMEAGVEGDEIEALLRRADDRGWELRSAWQLPPGGEFEPRIPFLEVASEASLLGANAVSIVLLEAAVDQQPQDPVALNNLGFALLETERSEEAGSLIERAFELDSMNASTVDSLGWMRYLQGQNAPDDPENAFFWIDRSIRIRNLNGTEASPEVLMHRGDAAWRSGRTTDAIADWRRVVDRGEAGLQARRLEAFDAYQQTAWGCILIGSDRLDSLSSWVEAARIRLEAVEAGEAPPVAPIFVESSNPDSGVQTEPD